MAGWDDGWGGGWDGGWQGGAPTGSLYTATGDLQSPPVIVSGSAARVFDATGALQVQPSTLNGGAVTQGVFAAVGSLLVQPSTGAGTADRIRVATGALVAQSSTMAGGAQNEDLLAAAGNLLAQPVTLAGVADRIHVATAALQAQPASLTGVALEAGSLTLMPEDIAAIANAVLEEIIEYDDLGHGITLRECMRLQMSAMCGLLSGAGTGTINLMKMNTATPRMTAQVDGRGNRTSVTHDYS